MIVIGIDPGIEKTGIGIIEAKGQKLNLIFKKLIKTDSKENHSVRLKKLYGELVEILDSYSIEAASIEELFFTKNAKTAFRVSEARGVMLLALEQKGIPIYSYTPLQVKQALVGYGKAEKTQVQELLKIILKLDESSIQDDVADGIAVAVTHVNTYKTISKISKNASKKKGDDFFKDYMDFRR